MTKRLGFWRFYVITILILMGAAAIPLWNLLMMLWNYTNPLSFKYFNIATVIPFMAVSSAILIGFLFLPVLWNMSMIKKRIITSVGAIGIFVGLSSFAETIAERLFLGDLLISSRRMPPPCDIAILQSSSAIPWAVRLHYYVFSIILILAVLNFLYNLANTRYGNGKPGNKIVAMQGIATVCYALAYFLVRVMQYENFAARQLTWGSVLNSAVCFMLAAIAVGLYSASFIKFKGFGRFVPFVSSIITVLVLYGAQYIMLEGNFYSYSNDAIVTIFFRVLITVIPGVVVHFLLKYMYGDCKNF